MNSRQPTPSSGEQHRQSTPGSAAAAMDCYNGTTEDNCYPPYSGQMNNGFVASMYNEDDYAACNEFMQSIPTETQQPIQNDIVHKKSSSKQSQLARGKNFSDDEDILLVSGWLNMSIDAINGTNQSKGTFWSRVHAYYMQNRESLAERTQTVLQHRWQTIQEAVQKFCSCVSQVETRNRSGNTIHDKIEEAEKMYRTLYNNNKPFRFRHCWLRLRNQPKWIEKLQQLEAAKINNKKQKTAKESTTTSTGPINVEASSPESIDGPPPEVEPPSRPIGKKRAKDQLCRSSQETYIEAFDILWAKKKESDMDKESKKQEWYSRCYDLDKENVQIDKERLQLEQENMQIKRMVEEERIMTMDFSTLNDNQKEFYTLLQNEILTRRRNATN